MHSTGVVGRGTHLLCVCACKRALGVMSLYTKAACERLTGARIQATVFQVLTKPRVCGSAHLRNRLDVLAVAGSNGSSTVVQISFKSKFHM